MSQLQGPDFICVGMPKAGTDWLFDQLQFHPDFWMPPLKEIHYLDREHLRAGNARKFLDHIRTSSKQLEKRLSQRRPWDDRDIQFLEEMEANRGEALNLQSYTKIFRYKGDLLTGDITPAYSSLTDDVVKSIARELPSIRIIMLVRDPIARIWSHISMWHRAGNFDDALLDNPQKFLATLSRSKKALWARLRDVSFPSRVVARWREHAPDVAFRHYFLDDIASQPDVVRREVLQYLGADPSKPSGALLPGHNRKAQSVKLSMPDAIKAALVDFFAEELRDSAVVFGEQGKKWASLYGL